jgi:hypothetical protein
MADPVRQLKATFGATLEWPNTAGQELGQKSEIVQQMENARRLVRSIYDGTDTMRERGSEYLPKEPGESTEAYNHRIKRTFLFNGVARTVLVLAGKPFAKPIQLGEDVNKKLAEWTENIDNTGRNLTVFSRDLFIEALLDGVSYFLVDMMAAPKDESGKEIKLNRAQADARGNRVYWVQYSADEVLGWKSEVRNGRPFLTQLRLKAKFTKSVSDYAEEEQEGVLILVPGGWAAYVLVETEEGEENTYALVEFGKTSLGFIPFVPIYTKRAGFLAGLPPLSDLADLNQAHWQSSSDQRHILHISRVPILFAKGWNLPPGEKVELGPSRMLSQESKDADLSYVEITGQGLEAGRLDLQDLKEEMGDVAMRLLIPKTGDVTATQTGIEAAEAHSALQAMAESLQDSLETGLAYSAAFIGVTTGGGSVKVHTDFGIGLHDTEVGKLLAEGEAKGQISTETLWMEWKRRSILSDAFDEEIEKERLDKKAEEETKRASELAELMKPAAPAGEVPSEGQGEAGDTSTDTPTQEGGR